MGKKGMGDWNGGREGKGRQGKARQGKAKAKGSKRVLRQTKRGMGGRSSKVEKYFSSLLLTLL